MKVSYNWLCEVSGIHDEASVLIAKLTAIGIKFEGQEAVGDDLMIDFEITVNRPDCLSVYGIARELCAAYGKPAPALPVVHDSNVLVTNAVEGSYPAGVPALRVILEAPDLCPRYCAQVLTNVKVGPSPDWLRKKIEACGVRSINNVVDVSNYVMLELGQPTHAFDYDRITHQTIRVRLGRNEKTMLLDGKERLITDSMLAIADDAVIVGLGGVMGGKDSEVTDSTTTILLESAYFQPSSIRKTRRELDMSTDASFRFERGVDPSMQAFAERRAALLLQQVAGAQVHPLLDVSVLKVPSISLSLRYERVERVLGEQVPAQEVNRILNALGFEKETETDWRVPSFRVDMKREIDLIEEIARHHGYNNFPDTLPAGEKKYQPDYPTYELERKIAHFMQSAGIDEASAYSLVNPASPYIPDQSILVRLLNPISEAVGSLRAAIIPGLMDAVELNVRHRYQDVRLYEIGRVFREGGERIHAGAVMWGDPLELKGVIESMMTALNYDQPVFRSGNILLGGESVGLVGHATVEGHAVHFFEISLDQLLKVPQSQMVFQPIIPFPFVERDASLILDESVPYSALQETIGKLAIHDLRSYRLTDRYKGKNMPEGKVSLTLRFIFQSEERTLLSEEVDVMYAKIIDALTQTHTAELRK